MSRCSPSVHKEITELLQDQHDGEKKRKKRLYRAAQLYIENVYHEHISISEIRTCFNRIMIARRYATFFDDDWFKDLFP